MTIRTKLTALFSVLFMLLAAVLVATSYAFVARTTTPQAQQEQRVDVIQEALEGANIEAADDMMRGMNDRGRGRVADALNVIDAQVRDQLLSDFLARSLLAFVLVAAVAIPLAFWLAGRVLRPVDDITMAANNLSESTLDSRLPDAGVEDEFGRLRRSFNSMLGRLEGSFEGRQRFAADASHELRTPLAVMGASADNVLESPRSSKPARELAETVREQVDRSESLIASLLTLARADDVSRTREAVDLADVVANVVAAAADSAAAAGVSLDLELADAPTTGDRVLLERAVANLVDNAVRYNLADSGWVRCRVSSENGAAVVEVSNSGPVVAQQEVPALFERFNRGERRHEQGGHGLGLPIVAKVADAHQGAVHATARAEGGLSVTVRLPH
jgi:signal transduction histidine kinase